MRHFALILTAATALAAAPACAQTADMPGSDQAPAYDPMAIPAGMQAVPVVPQSIPVGAHAQARQAQIFEAQIFQDEVLQDQGTAALSPSSAQAAERHMPEVAPGLPVASAAGQILPVSQPIAAPDQPPAFHAQAQSAPQAQMPAGLQQQLLRQQQQALQPKPCVPGMTLQLSHGITYMTGGTTQQEIDRFKAMDAEFNLQLLFAAGNGDHLVNHQLRILDYRNFELVKAVAVGPYLYARINPGDYSLEVVHEPGMEPVSMKLRVPAKDRLRKTILLK